MSATQWYEVTGAVLNIEVPEDARGLLITSNLRARSPQEQTITIYSRININNDDFISPETTLTVENRESWGSGTGTDIMLFADSINAYFLKNGDTEWIDGNLEIKAEMKPKSYVEDTLYDCILTAITFLR